MAQLLGSLALSFVAPGLCPGSVSALPATQTLQRVRAGSEVVSSATVTEFPVLSSAGERIGTFAFTAEGVALHPPSGGEILAPGLARWLGSPDGRTLVGVGDPSGVEEPVRLDVLVLRDARTVARLEKLAPEAELTVADDGRVAVVGPETRLPDQPFAALLDPEGALLFRQALPRDTQGRDPLIFDDHLLVRSHGVEEEGVGGEVLRVDSRGVQSLLDSPGALSLVGFPGARRALVLSRVTLTWFDADDGRTLWQRQVRLRPAGRHAWDYWRSSSGDYLALVTAEVRKRGATASAFALVLIDPADGAELARAEWNATGPPCEVNVRSSPQEIVVESRGVREVFRWSR